MLHSKPQRKSVQSGCLMRFVRIREAFRVFRVQAAVGFALPTRQWHPIRALFGFFLLVVLLANFVAGSPTAFAAERPNVLFIISDDLTAEALGCYGNRQCRTPHIDALAGRGVRFTRAYCQFPICGPSRAALMSGMYAESIGVTGNGAASRFTQNLGDRPSWAEHFKDNGYYTARVSKIYHMRIPGDITAGVHGPDHAASWTERFSFQAPEWMTEGEHEHLTDEKLNRDPDKHYRLGFGGAFYVVRGISDGAEQPDVMATNKAVDILESHGGEPFFLAVGLVRPHVPLVAPARYFEPYPSGSIELPMRRDDDWNDIPRAGIPRSSKAIGLAGELEKQRKVLAAYYASVSFMDAQVGRLLDALDRLGLRENTIVIFTSDHGYHLGEHDFWQKMSLHEESARIPLIISMPGKSAATTDSLAQQIDLYPTLSELCDLPVPAHCQGKSLAGVLENPDATVHEAVYSFKGNGHLVRTDRWAYMAYRDGSQELYDMHNDPQQFTNLFDDPQHAETVAELRKRLADHQKATARRFK